MMRNRLGTAEGESRRAGSRAVLRRPTFAGLLLALVSWWQSVTPTLIPRPWLAQALVSGVSLAIGYGVGSLIGRWVQRLLALWGRSPGAATRRWLWIALGGAWAVSSVVGSALWLGWQNDQRDLMGMSEVGWFDATLWVVVGAAVAASLVVIGRATGNGLRALTRYAGRHVPGVAAPTLVVLLVVVLVLVLGGGLAHRTVTRLADSIFGPQNDETEEGVWQPTSVWVSGSSESLVSWESLGRTGRNFVAGVTTRSELERFHGSGSGSVDPVRAYVGVLSADTLQARADLAVRELDRAGGFEREVLVVWVPTGSGWMIPEAAEAIEQLYNGDSAIVGMQYSYLPSLLSVFLDPGMAIEAGSALFSAVEKRWAELPPDSRPKLLLFGKSLGTSGVEAPFAAVDAESSIGNLVARTDGALIVGAKYVNTILTQLTDQRDPGSPVWQPIYDQGRTVRFLSRDPRQPALGPYAAGPRIVYLQHPSDPVPFWGVDVLWRSPEWMDSPRGYDVPEASRWFPVISGVHAVSDLVLQLYPPPGFGHDYATDYTVGWAEVVPPEGWTADDTQRLEDFLDHGASGESQE